MPPEGENFALKFAIILPTRRWILGSLEYSGSAIAGDFIHARRGRAALRAQLSARNRSRPRFAVPRPGGGNAQCGVRAIENVLNFCVVLF